MIPNNETVFKINKEMFLTAIIKTIINPVFWASEIRNDLSFDDYSTAIENVLYEIWSAALFTDFTEKPNNEMDWFFDSEEQLKEWLIANSSIGKSIETFKSSCPGFVLDLNLYFEHLSNELMLWALAANNLNTFLNKPIGEVVLNNKRKNIYKAICDEFDNRDNWFWEPDYDMEELKNHTFSKIWNVMPLYIKECAFKSKEELERCIRNDMMIISNTNFTWHASTWYIKDDIDLYSHIDKVSKDLTEKFSYLI